MMQQQIRTQTPKKNKPAASLIISWLIILGVYLLLRLVFVIFGFHLAPVVLGGCLAVLPYIAGAFYLFKTPAAHRVGGCVLGILLPSIVEKLVLYFLGASLYGIPLADVSGVMSRIAANEPCRMCNSDFRHDGYSKKKIMFSNVRKTEGICK